MPPSLSDAERHLESTATTPAAGTRQSDRNVECAGGGCRHATMGTSYQMISSLTVVLVGVANTRESHSEIQGNIRFIRTRARETHDDARGEGKKKTEIK